MYFILATKETTYRDEAPVTVIHLENKPAAKRKVEELKQEKVYGERKYRRVEIKPVVTVEA